MREKKISSGLPKLANLTEGTQGKRKRALAVGFMLTLSTPSKAVGPTAASHYWAAERVIGAMRKHLDDTINRYLENGFSLQEMAAVARMSPCYFNRTFGRLTGIPPCRFLSALRLEAARRLLLTTEVSVTDICFEVGFNSLGTFIRRFTDLLGVSPGRFRLLAQSPLPSKWRGLTARPDSPEEFGAGLTGWVSAPSDFRGLIFVGLFRDPIPQGRPVACVVMERPGRFRITAVPDGRFYLFGAGLAWSREPKQYFLYDSALRAGGQPIWIRNGAGKGSCRLPLRPPAPLDPPILVTLPLLLARRAENEHTHEKLGLAVAVR